MSDDVYRATEPTPSEPAPASRSPADLADALPPLQVEINALYDGEHRDVHPDPHSAAKEWARKRRENAEATGDTAEADKPPVDDILHYPDERPEVSVKQAADDINTYRAQKAAQLLAEMTGEQPEQPPIELQQLQQQYEQPATPVSGEQLYEEFTKVASPQLQQALATEVNSAREQISAQWQAAETAKQNYTIILNALAANARGHNAKEFADIRSEADAIRVQTNEPARWSRYVAMHNDLAQVQQEIARLNAEGQQQFQQNYRQFAAQHDAAVEQMVPELSPNADASTRRALQESSMAVMREAGFTAEQLYHAWNNGSPVYLRDSRAQKIVADAAKWRMAQARAKEMSARPAPPVQRPGNGFQRTSYDDMDALRKQLANSGSLKDAARLRSAQVAARKRGY